MDEAKQAAQMLDQAQALLITTGAGMGVDSGLPDFRGNEGFWNAYPPMRHLGISFAEMANPHWFDTNPGLAWGFYGHRLNLYRETVPHKGFATLLEFGQQKQFGVFVFTSNVDGQFQIAGFSDEQLEEVHGSIHHLQCTVPCSDSIWSADNTSVQVDAATFLAQGELPLCPHCGRLARPNILMFGDYGWISNRSSDQSERLRTWLHQIPSGKLAVLELGAGLAVPTVRYKSESMIRQYGAKLVRVNPRDTQVPHGHISIASGGLAGIKEIFSRL